MTETRKPSIREAALAAIQEVQERRAAERLADDDRALTQAREGLIKAVFAMFGIGLDTDRITVVGRPDSNPNCCFESATARCMIEGMEFGVCYRTDQCSVGYLALIRHCTKCGEEVWQHVTGWPALGEYLQADANHPWNCVKTMDDLVTAPAPAPLICSAAERTLLDAFTDYVNWLHAEAE